jgi:uncharacterized protein (DUF58 family)
VADHAISPPEAPPWDAEVLSRVRHLHVAARIVTDSLRMGEHRSRRVGQAVEFADHQEYVPGMDLRALDWKVLGRSDRLVVRRYETETELACTLVLDLSGDLGTGATARQGYPPLKGSKAGYAISLAATIAYWFHRHHEPVGLHLVGGDRIRWPVLPPRTGRNHLQSMFLQLAAARPGGRAELSRALGEVGRRVRRRSFVVVISDGMEEPSAWLPALQAFGRRGTDLRFVHLFDRRELTLDFDGSALFYSPEGGDALAVDPKGARKDFRQVVDAYLHEVRGGVVRAGGQYVPAATDVPLERVIRTIVHGGSLPVDVP